MKGWKDERMKGWNFEWKMKEWKDESLNERMNGWMNEWINQRLIKFKKNLVVRWIQ